MSSLDQTSLKIYQDFYIQSKNVKIVKFRFNEFGFSSNVEKLETDTSFCDLVMFDDANIIDSWLQKRLLPLNRENGAKLLHNHKLANIPLIASNQLFLSLSDTFWLNPIENERKWEEVSLYSNNVDIDLYELALYGKEEGISNKSGITPEYTTGGHLAKGWLYDDATKLWSLKKGAGFFPGEPLSEVLAYEIATQLNFNCVKYTYEEKKNDSEIKSYSVCPNFTNEDNSFLPAYTLSEYSKYSGSFTNDEFFMQNQFHNAFTNMCILDAIIFNDDRHYNNFGVLYDSNTGEIKEFSQLFDNGQSLLYNLHNEDLSNYKNHINRIKDMKTQLKFSEMLEKYDINNLSNTIKQLDLVNIGSSFESKFGKRIQNIRKGIEYQISNLI